MTIIVAEPEAVEELDLMEAVVGLLAGRLLLRVPEQPFLASVAERALGDVVTGPELLSKKLATVDEEMEHLMGRRDSARHPLVVLSRVYALSPFELDLALLAALPELDERFAAVFRSLSVSARRLTVGDALGYLIAEDTDRAVVRSRLSASRLWTAGLLRASEASLFDRPLEASAALSDGLEGCCPTMLESGARTTLLPPGTDRETELELCLRPALRELTDELASWWRAVGGDGVVHVSGKRSYVSCKLARAVTERLGLPLLRVTHERGDVESTIREASLSAVLSGSALEIDIPDGARADNGTSHSDSISLPNGWIRPVLTILVTPATRELEFPSSCPARRAAPPSARPLEQVAVWNHFLSEVAGEAEVDRLSNQTHLSTEQIARVTRLAAEYARLASRAGGPIHADVIQALAEVVPEPSSALATVTRPDVPWKRLVFDRPTVELLEDFISRVEHRVTVRDRWSMKGLAGRGEGLVALLHGDSGTGKTLAVEAIATRLDMPLLSVDLSRVVSKYIGETEKNMAELFDLAEGFRAVLFFDEADALFGKRTGVRDAHDRFANIEVNFLLQRLEGFEGLSILSSNKLQNIDDAFTRRLQFMIHVPRPSPGQQLAIWRQHLPVDHVSRKLDLEEIVTRFDLVGGDIRNATLSAAYSAAARNQDIDRGIIIDAIKREFTKKGKPMPAN